MFRQPSVSLILYIKSEASEEALCSALGGGGLLPGHATYDATVWLVPFYLSRAIICCGVSTDMLS